jgi:hypothetical protein
VRDIKTGRRVALAVGAVWMAWAVWDQFLTLPADEIANHSSAVVQDRMQDCSGTFRQRYECKNLIIVESDRSTFFQMVGRIAIVVVPPLLLWGALTLADRRRGPAEYDFSGEPETGRAQPIRRQHRRRSSHHS